MTLKNLIGSQAAKLSEIPDSLDEVVSLIGKDNGGTKEEPLIIEKTITFEVPNEWTKQFNRELKRAQGMTLTGCSTFSIGMITILLLVVISITLILFL